uniref:Dihydroorotate dehydrogenase (quinone), mitochondrial n=1 Tax=Rhabditophanes sp. KR3021 TaxID=114890 RepID=A0AC35UAA4_9BILA
MRQATAGQQFIKLMREGMLPTIIGGGTLFVGLQLITGSERFHNEVIMPLVHKYVDGETAHKAAIMACKLGLYPRYGFNKKEYDNLASSVLDKHFKNPLGIGAGFDKHGEIIENMSKMGWGFVEIGSITPAPQDGNPKPRLFRLLEDKAVINRYGFNSEGGEATLARVKKVSRSNDSVPFGINLGKNKSQADASADYIMGMKTFGQYADYIVINVSSPNTPGLRSLQSKEELSRILASVNQERNKIKANNEASPKLILKIAPDLIKEDLVDIANVVCNKEFGVDALIVSNTTISRPQSLSSEFKKEVGGLSGAPLKELSISCISKVYQLTNGKIPIIGCGGIENGQDAYDKIKAGASLVQIYTAMVYQGFPVIGRIKRELSELVEKDGYKSVTEAVGVNSKLFIEQTRNSEKKYWFW